MLRSIVHWCGSVSARGSRAGSDHVRSLFLAVALASTGCIADRPFEAPRTLHTDDLRSDDLQRVRSPEDRVNDDDFIVTSEHDASGLPDPDRPRTLAELIDLAQSRNPRTRAAWARARSAALAVGLIDGVYEPMLAASIMAGYERAVFPILEVPPLIDRNNFTAETAAITPGLELSWLIFDFGRRESLVRAADARAVAADAGFHVIHRELAWQVTTTFLRYDAARGAVADAEVALKAARALEEAVAARRSEGMATEVDLLRAVRSRVQAAFELESARAEVERAGIDLLDAVSLPPGSPLKIVSSADDPLPIAPPDAERLVTEALSRRADVAEAMALYRASRADLDAARAGRRPTIRAGGNVSFPAVAIDVENIGWADTIEPWYGAWVGIQIPLLDGELTDTRVRIALNDLAAASAEVNAARDRTVREVWNAWIDLSTAIRRRAVVEALRDASEASYEAAMASYREGLADVIDVDEARRGLADAIQIDRVSRATIREAAATLAFVTGTLTAAER